MEKQRMKAVRHAFKGMPMRIVAGTALTAMIVVTTAQVSLAAHDDQDRDRPGIEGVWDVNVTIWACDTGAPVGAVHAMNMFIEGGTLTETSNDLLRSSSLGTWRQVTKRGYTAVFRFFTFNPDGSVAGQNKITRAIRLGADANGFVANAVFQILDLNDNVIATGCATEVAKRLED